MFTIQDIEIKDIHTATVLLGVRVGDEYDHFIDFGWDSIPASDLELFKTCYEELRGNNPSFDRMISNLLFHKSNITIRNTIYTCDEIYNYINS